MVPKGWVYPFANIQNMSIETFFHVVGNCGEFW